MVETGAHVRTLIIRLFSPAEPEVSRLRGVVQRPGGETVRFTGADELVAVVEALGQATASASTSRTVEGTGSSRS